MTHYKLPQVEVALGMSGIFAGLQACRSVRLTRNLLTGYPCLATGSTLGPLDRLLGLEITLVGARRRAADTSQCLGCSFIVDIECIRWNHRAAVWTSRGFARFGSELRLISDRAAVLLTGILSPRSNRRTAAPSFVAAVLKMCR
jgi:hypothetical protein